MRLPRTRLEALRLFDQVLAVSIGFALGVWATLGALGLALFFTDGGLAWAARSMLMSWR